MLYSIRFLDREIPTYALFMVLGVLASAVVAVILAKKRKGVDTFGVVVSAIYTMVGALLGAKLLYIVISFDRVVEGIEKNGYGFWDSLFYILNSGFVFYGGFIFGFLALLLFIYQFKQKARDYFTIYAVVLPLGHALGRIGCFCGGCCYGMEYDGIFAVGFPLYPSYEGSPVVSRLPIQLFEAAGLLILFAVLVYLYYRCSKMPTLPLWTYLFVYPVFRFILEFFRGDEARGGFWGFSTSQWISLGILVVSGLAFYFTQIKKKKNENGVA